MHLVVLVSFACAGPKPFVFDPSRVTPAAMGQVATSNEPNGNTRVKVRVHHLAPPERVAPGATVYVVWVTDLETGTDVRSLGALRVDQNLSGTLESLTPLRNFDLTITAETAATVVAPTGEPVLKARITARS